MTTVFVVEDDDNIRELVLYALASAGFAAEGFDCASVFWKRLDQVRPTIVLLDILLPDEDGITILKKLKYTPDTSEIPVIMATAKGTEIDRITGLDLGADDYLTKPFSVLELISRIKAVLRRSEGRSISALDAGAIHVNIDKRYVTVAGEKTSLTYKEFELLALLMLNKGIVLSRDTIIERVWGVDYDGESRTVDMHIKTLRQKLGVCGQMIKTHRNVGYQIEE